MSSGQSGSQNFANVFENEEMDFLLLSDYFKGDRDAQGDDERKGTRKRDLSKSNASSNQPNLEDNDGDDMDEEEDGKDSKGKRNNKLNTKRRGNTVDRRRERNRVLARKTRLRKKYFFESLQLQVSQLSNENKNLKLIVRDKINNAAGKKILSECSSEIPAVLTNNNKKGGQTQSQPNDIGKTLQTAFSSTSSGKSIQQRDLDLFNIIQAAQRSFIITDPSLPDNPIMFASPGFLELSKYSLDEVIGRNCRFLQGPGTDMHELQKLRKNIEMGLDTSVILLNYKKDGTPFYNQIFVAGLRNAAGQIVNYVGVQAEIKLSNRVLPDSGEAMKQVNNILLTTQQRLPQTGQSIGGKYGHSNTVAYGNDGSDTSDTLHHSINNQLLDLNDDSDNKKSRSNSLSLGDHLSFNSIENLTDKHFDTAKGTTMSTTTASPGLDDLVLNFN